MFKKLNFVFFVFLLSCSSLPNHRLSAYPEDVINSIYTNNWLIDGKISFVNGANNLRGNLQWKSGSKGDFVIDFYQSINNRSLKIAGNYFKKPITVYSQNDTYQFTDLNSTLNHYFNWQLNWQQLVLWLNYQIPTDAIKLAKNKANQIQSFKTNQYQVQYLSFFTRQSNIDNKVKVKLVKITQLNQNGNLSNQSLKIALLKPFRLWQ